MNVTNQRYTFLIRCGIVRPIFAAEIPYCTIDAQRSFELFTLSWFPQWQSISACLTFDGWHRDPWPLI